MNTTQKTTLNKEQLITTDNIRNLGEWAALQVVRSNFVREIGCPFLRKAYGDLIRDVHNFSVPGYTLSDAYDAAQEAIAFFCRYIGRTLNDTVIDRKGEPVSIYIACFRAVNGYIQRNQRKARKVSYIDDLPYSMFTVPFESDTDEPDYAAVNAKIAAMNLTECQSNVLFHRMSGASMKGTARALSVTIKPVYQAIYKIRAKYFNAFGNLDQFVL